MGRLGDDRFGFAADGDVRAPTVNYERNRSLPETRAECGAVIHAKNQVENGSRQTVLLREP
jgi:hypothetical protein